MPLITPLNIPPYNDDISPQKKYYHIGFKPSVSVQGREMNEFQTIYRTQLERFGDAIFEKGTIIKGCNFSFFSDYPYAKISDTTVDGLSSLASLYFSLFAQNEDGLKAFITNTLDGFEGSTIQKTLYLTYVNSGSNNNSTSFDPGDTLTISSGNYPIFSINVDNGSFNFGSTDRLVVSSAITVNVTSGSFSNGDYLIQPTTGANVQIIGITTIPFSNSVILSIKPRDIDLADISKTDSDWSFALLDDVKNTTNTAIGSITYIWGEGFQGDIDINSTGKVINVEVTNRGTGYQNLPWVGVQSANNSSGIGSLVLTPKNYLTQVKVLSSDDAVGNGYAFSVSNGVIYQRGLFLLVDAQTIIVDPYDNQPNNVSVGFDTQESIETYLTDPDLYDNSLITQNILAPGADRVKANPVLIVANTDSATINTEFFPLVSWNSGNPFRQQQTSVYSAIGDEMARRTSETSGDFVLDPFLCTTDAITNTQIDGQYYTVVVDPGTAYIDGYRVATLANYRVDVPKATSTKIANSQKISLDYGPYVRINELGGVFQFSTGDTITFYDTPKTFLSNGTLATTANVSPVGSIIGTARARSLILESGLPGDASAIYRLYLFNLSVNAGKNFRNARSVAYNGTYKGIADCILILDATTNTNIASVSNVSSDTLVFYSGLESIKKTANTSYIYRTIDQTATMANSGILTKSIASIPNEFFPYSGILSGSQLSDLYVVPLGNTITQFTPLTGNVSVNTTSNVVTGIGANFITDVAVGDYIYITSGASVNIRRVTNISNSTSLTVDSNCTFTNATSTYKRTFPKYVPIPFGKRAGLSANVNANGNILNLNLGFAIDSPTSVNVAIAVNIQRTGVSSSSKNVNRNQFVKLSLANSVGGVAGPWCLGVSDAYRLRHVYIGNSSVSNTSPDAVNEFYLETNQNLDYNDLSYLTLDQKSSLSFTGTETLLVSFDYYSPSGSGYYDTVSYLHTSNAAQIATLDSTPLSNLTTSACSWEVPEIYSDSGFYADLLNCIDFRPAVANTVAPGSNSSNAPINPGYVLSFGNTADPTTDKKFPVPGSLFTSDIEGYLGRIDDVIIGHDGNIVVFQGNPNADITKRTEPSIPDSCLKLQTISVPAYPNISKNINLQIADLISTRAVNEVYGQARIGNHTVLPLLDANNVSLDQPTVYTEKDIGNLERRIAALEFQASVTSLESDVTKRIIPSSIDGSINRFKYGFFVDDFSSYIYSDVTNPQFSSTIETQDGDLTLSTSNLPKIGSNLMVPSKFVWPLKHIIQQIQPVADDYVIVNQNTATNFLPPCNLVSQSITDNTVGTAVYFDVIRAPGLTPKILSQTRSLVFGNVAASVNLFYYFAFDPKITVYQNGVAIISTSSARAMTSADVAYMNANPVRKQFWAALRRIFGSSTLQLFEKFADGFVQYGGKLVWNHNPAKGLNYNILVSGITDKNGVYNVETHTGELQYMVEYPVSQSVTTQRVVQVCTGTQPTIFTGTMSANSLLNTMNSVTNAVNTGDVLVIQCSGLKPNTKHSFVVDSITQSNTVKQTGKNYGDDLVTDDQGSITINYALPSSWYSQVAKSQVPTITPSTKYTGISPYGNHGGVGGAYAGAADLVQTQKIYDGLIISDAFSLFEIEATNSYASKYVKIVTPNKISF